MINTSQHFGFFVEGAHMLRTLPAQRCALLRRGAAVAPRCTRARLCISSKLVLVPVGDGSTEHLGVEVERPGRLELLAGKLYELGRAEPADLVVAIPTVSGRHAMLRVGDDNTVSVTDLSSTNGTYIDDQEIKPMKATPLEVGASVTFGDKYLAKYQLVVEADSPEPEAEQAEDILAA